MRRPAVRAGCLATVVLCAGCAVVERREDAASLDPAETAMRRQLSQAAQTAIDARDWEAAKIALHHLLARAPRLAEAHHRLGRVFPGRRTVGPGRIGIPPGPGH